MSMLLHEAVLANDVEAVLDLLAMGWDLNTRYKDCFGSTPLHLIAENSSPGKDNLRLLKVLTDFGADVNCLNYYWKSPLHLAVNTFNIPVIAHLLCCGAEVDTRDYLNQTPLHIISSQVTKQPSDLSKQIKIVQVLLKSGADVSAKTNYGETPIFLASRYGANSEIVKILIDHDADVNFAFPSDGSTPLHYASVLFDKRLIKLLINNGACVNSKDIMGRTPLMWALERPYNNNNKEYEQAMTVLTLLMNGADVNLNDFENKNILNINVLLDSDCFRCILEHLAKLKTLEFEIHASLLETISRREDLKSYFAQCEKECLDIRSTEIVEYSVSFFDLLAGSEKTLWNICSIETLIEFFVDTDLKGSFPIYASYMYKNLFSAIKRRRLCDKAAKLFKLILSITEDYLSDLIIEDIFTLLTKDELKKLCGQL